MSEMAMSEMAMSEKRRVLLFDDDVALAATWIGYLEADFDVDHAEDMAEAVELLNQAEYDVVVCDLFIKKVDGVPNGEGGVTLISALRNKLFGMPAWGRTVPIIAITGAGQFNGFDPLRVAGNVGAETLLRKPVSPAQLIDAVSSEIDRARSDSA